MFDPAISLFLSERKEGWLKKKLTSNMMEDEMAEVKKECEEIFCLENWLPNASKRAGQISISTHPCTFSHPSSRKNNNGYVTSIIATAPLKADGYLRSGNTAVKLDAFGNAAALDVYKFLSIELEDGATVLEHIQQDTALAKSLLNIKTESYTNLKKGFMEMVSSDETMITSSKIKQVYFPFENNYHQLSILSNSGMIFEQRKRIDALRFSDAVKEGREKRRNNVYSDPGYSEIYNIVTIGYGGTKPQNISVLNNQYGGKSHLLLSVPPTLKQSKINFPTKDFFTQSLHYSDCKEILERFKNIFTIKHDNQIPLEKIRKGRDNCLSDILDIILEKTIVLREASIKQFRPDMSNLPAWQRLWLCEEYKEQRFEKHDWINTLCERIAIWISGTYKNNVKHSVMLGEAERHYIKDFIDDNKEVLR